MAQMVKNLPAMRDTWVQSLDQEHTLEMGMATHSSILAWRIQWTDELGGLYSPWGHKESDTDKRLTLLVSWVWGQSEFGAGLFLNSLDNRMTYAAACFPLPSPHTQT